MTAKPRLVPLTDPSEIESARRNGAFDLRAVESNGSWWATREALEHYRSYSYPHGAGEAK